MYDIQGNGNCTKRKKCMDHVRYMYFLLLERNVLIPMIYYTYSHAVLVNIAERAPAQAAKVVLTAAKADVSPRLALLIVDDEPGLKPYQPNHKQKVPRNWQQINNACEIFMTHRTKTVY
jgi:hypothetical protein